MTKTEHEELGSLLRGILRQTRGTATLTRNLITVHRAVARASNVSQVQRDYHWEVAEELTAQLATMSELVVRLEELLMAGLEGEKR